MTVVRMMVACILLAFCIVGLSSTDAQADILVYDADGQFLGISQGIDNGVTFVYVPTIDLTIPIYQHTGKTYETPLYYESNDCTGTPYVNFPHVYLAFERDGNYYAGDKIAPLYIEAYSVSDPWNPSPCTERSNVTGGYLVPAKQIDLPFSLPVSLPLTQKVGTCKNPKKCSFQSPVVNKCKGNVQPTEEICDGLDNDCNGIIDDIPVTSTTCGVGVCASSGQLECQGGTMVDTCVPELPTEEPEITCDDSADNDCDGTTDILDSDCTVIQNINISPADVEVTNALATVSWHTTNFLIVVTNSSGIPIEDATLTISFPWAVPYSFGYVQLYDGTTPKDSPMAVQTDENGVYNLRIDYQSGGGLSYSGNLTVVSGAVFNSAGLTVSAGE